MNARDQAFLKAHQASRWLSTVDDLSDLPQVRIALRHGGYDEFEIDDMLGDAIRSEKDRRAIARQIRAPLEVACIAAFLIGIFAWCVPDRAYAADGRDVATWAFGWIFPAVAVGMIVLALVLTLRRHVRQVEQDDPEAYGDTTGLGQ
jgi:hypothetical protein